MCEKEEEEVPMKSLGNWQMPSFPGSEQNHDIHDMKGRKYVRVGNECADWDWMTEMIDFLIPNNAPWRNAVSTNSPVRF